LRDPAAAAEELRVIAECLTGGKSRRIPTFDAVRHHCRVCLTTS
jgi:hypothetical protein